MTLSIKDQEVDRITRKLAELMGVSITEAVAVAVQEKYERQERRRRARDGNRLERIMEISRRCAALPTRDTRSEDEILGYDENGIPTL